MAERLGQVVELRKYFLSSARKKRLVDNMSMPTVVRAPAAAPIATPWRAVEKAKYLKAFATRVGNCRVGAGYSQEEMAAFLGISQARYSKYEGRSFMPYYYVERFCDITNTTVSFLITGRK